jgi:large subunit ribosomal protein L4
MIRLALYSALSDRAAEGKVALIDDWAFAAPRTKDAVAALAALELEGRILVVLGPDDGIADRSMANLQRVQTLQVAELNAYDILRSDWVVFTDATVPGEPEPAPTSSTTARAPRRAAAQAPDADASEDTPADGPAGSAPDDSGSDAPGSDDPGSDQPGSDESDSADGGSDQ